MVLNASALPDPQLVSYDLLLTCVSFLRSVKSLAELDPIDGFFCI